LEMFRVRYSFGINHADLYCLYGIIPINHQNTARKQVSRKGAETHIK
jgi:hypothetical protein